MKKIIGFVLLTVVFYNCQSGKEKLKKEIAVQEKQLFADSLITPKEDSLVQKIIGNYQAYAKANPDDSVAPSYLFKAADLAKNTHNFKQAVDLFGLVIQKYPQSAKAPFALFLQAFTYENDMNDLPMAKKLYEEFLQKFPSHQLASSAKTSIDNLGKSPEELIKEFEAKAKADSAVVKK